MTDYRENTTGEVLSQIEWKDRFPGRGLSGVWNKKTETALNISPISEGQKPLPSGDYIKVDFDRENPVQDGLGKWTKNWLERPMFEEYTDDDGVHTVAEQKAKHLADLIVKRKKEIASIVEDQEESGELVINTTNITDLVVHTSAKAAARLQRADTYLGKNPNKVRREKVQTVNGGYRRVDLKKPDIDDIDNAVGDRMNAIALIHEMKDGLLDSCQTPASVATQPLDTGWPE